MTDQDSPVVDEVTRTAYEAMLERDWDGVAHAAPSVSALDNDRSHSVRGHTKVMELLRAGPPPAAPIAVELRDGQIYRWQEPP
jgi:hypothetical protein